MLHAAVSVTTFAAIAVALPALASAQSAVTFIPGAETTAAFAKGRPLVETAGYKVHASRRDGPGVPELHDRDTDIFYVLEGRATIVTGGRLVGGKSTAPDEMRGTAIEGGKTQQLTRGDVLIVPNGVPHWFSKVDGPFLYYVVKTTAGGQR